MKWISSPMVLVPIYKQYYSTPRGGDLVVQGGVPVAKFRVSTSAIYYLLGSKMFRFTTAQGCEN